MRIFASDKVSEIMKKLGMEEGEAIEHKWVSKSIENAQKRVEAHNFDIRKTLLEYDDISNEQRKLIYQQRNFILSNDGESLVSTLCLNYSQDYIQNNYDDLISNDSKLSDLSEKIKTDFLIDIDFDTFVEDNQINETKLQERLKDALVEKIESVTAAISSEEYNELIKNISLAVIDEEYRNHLNSMDYLRQSIGLRGYAQKILKTSTKENHLKCLTLC